jgi:hypothetical protein
MKAHEAVLVAEVLASEAIGLEAGLAIKAGELQALILCHLMAEEIEQKMAPSDRDAIRKVVAATNSFHPIGEAAAKVVRRLGNERH